MKKTFYLTLVFILTLNHILGQVKKSEIVNEFRKTTDTLTIYMMQQNNSALVIHKFQIYKETQSLIIKRFQSLKYKQPKKFFVLLNFKPDKLKFAPGNSCTVPNENFNYVENIESVIKNIRPANAGCKDKTSFSIIVCNKNYSSQHKVCSAAFLSVVFKLTCTLNKEEEEAGGIY